MTRKQLRTEKIELRIAPQLKDQVRTVAEQEGMTISGWVELAIREALKRKPQAGRTS